jgi:spermidine synthase
MKPWQTLATVATPDGRLELRQRGAKDFLIVIDGRPLMTSVAHASETELARLVCTPLASVKRPRVLIGGLGMGYTLRAALDELPADAEVHMVELTSEMVDWCRGPMASLSNNAVDDPRVQIQVGDVSKVIASAPAGRYESIVLDLYEGPNPTLNRADDPFYGSMALKRTAAALVPGGTLAVWSEEVDPTFERKMVGAGFAASLVRVRRGGRTHAIYLGKRA